MTATFDASPKCLLETERMLRNQDNVLRFFTVKMDTAFDRSRGKSFRNPYLKSSQQYVTSSGTK